MGVALMVFVRSSSQAALRAFQVSRDRPAVRLVDAATRAAEEDPDTERIERPALVAPELGGCVTCRHLPRVHERGFDGQRVPCKALHCGCPKYRRLRTWRDWARWTAIAVFALVVVVFYGGCAVWAVAAR